MATRRKLLRLDDARQVAGALSPARLEIVEALQIHGAATVTELAGRLGRAPDRLYHHLRRLKSSGIVRPAGVRESGGRNAAVFELCAEGIRADLRPGVSPAFRRAWADVAGAVLRRAERELRRAAADERATSSGRHATVHAQRIKAWLTPADLARVNDAITALRALVREHGRRRAGATLYTWTTAFAPLPDHHETRRDESR